MMQAAYDYNNLEALCENCHEARHRLDNRSKTKAQTKKAAQEVAEGFVQRWCQPSDDTGV